MHKLVDTLFGPNADSHTIGAANDGALGAGVFLRCWRCCACRASARSAPLLKRDGSISVVKKRE